MTQKIEAIYENGVFVPAHPLMLAEHERVNLIVESFAAEDAGAVEIVKRGRLSRLIVDRAIASNIALSHEFDLLDTP